MIASTSDCSVLKQNFDTKENLNKNLIYPTKTNRWWSKLK